MRVGETRTVDITARVCPDATCNTVLVNTARAYSRIAVTQSYLQPFTSNQGDFTIANASGGADWAWNQNCPAALLATGHTSPAPCAGAM